MFREMRRIKKQTTNERAIEFLKEAPNGVLAVLGDDGYPYAVPVSFAYTDGKIVFHSSSVGGHKLDAISKCEKVSFCVVTQDNINSKDFNSIFRSVVVFGKARILEDVEEKTAGLEAILKKYSPDFLESGREYIKNAFDDTSVVEITIDYMTGKAAD